MDTSIDDQKVFAVIPGAGYAFAEGVVEAQVALASFKTGPTFIPDPLHAQLTTEALRAAEWAVKNGKLVNEGDWMCYSPAVQPNVMLRLELHTNQTLMAYRQATRH